VAGLSEAIQRVGNTVGIKTVPLVIPILTHVKPKGKGKKKDLIYKIPCECGTKYIRKTGRPLDIRVREHRINRLKLDRERDEAATSSLLASHAVEHNHQVN
jgi:hypothetical protein